MFKYINPNFLCRVTSVSHSYTYEKLKYWNAADVNRMVLKTNFALHLQLYNASDCVLERKEMVHGEIIASN